jgi:hypothetical protein
MESFTATANVYSKILSFVCNGPIPSSWHQPFLFKECTNCLRQFQDGPCGAIAFVQAQMLILLKSHSD